LRPVGVLLAGSPGCLLSTAFRTFVVQVDPPWAEQSLLWLPMFLDRFAIGMALAVLSAAIGAGQALPRPLAWLGAHPNLCWILAGLIFFAVTRMSYPDQPFGLHGSDGSSDYLPRQFAYGVASASGCSQRCSATVGRAAAPRAELALPRVPQGDLARSTSALAIIDQVKA
jgi:hypothetical protein